MSLDQAIPAAFGGAQHHRPARFVSLVQGRGKTHSATCETKVAEPEPTISYSAASYALLAQRQLGQPE
jgi:hypothetical protein